MLFYYFFVFSLYSPVLLLYSPVIGFISLSDRCSGGGEIIGDIINYSIAIREPIENKLNSTFTIQGGTPW